MFVKEGMRLNGNDKLEPNLRFKFQNATSCKM